LSRFAILNFLFPFSEPNSRRSRVRFELGQLGIELRLAVIELPLPRAKIFGKLLGLTAKLLVVAR
jgi:hypothetical protein